MYHFTFGNTSFEIAILIKHAALSESELVKYYLDPMKAMGIDTTKVIAFSLEYDKKKPSAKCRKAYLDTLLPVLDDLNVHTLLCMDGEYFKTLTKETKAEVHLGAALSLKYQPVPEKDEEPRDLRDVSVLYGLNYQSYFYNPDNKVRNELVFKALQGLETNTYTELGADVLKDVTYVSNLAEMEQWLDKLLTYPKLALDIEAFSLKHYSAGIGTISFSWDKHSAVVFQVDAVACEPHQIDVWDKKDKCFKKRTAYIKQVDNPAAYALLRRFFTRYEGKHIWHNASYDLYVLTYVLFMENLLDKRGMLRGLDVLLRNYEDTQLITYLATNSCAGNTLGLKENAHEFVGNYALDVKDIRLQTLPELLEYNAVDTCATMYVYEKHYPTMVRDQQEDFYRNLFHPMMHDILEMQLTGMVIDLNRTREAQKELEAIREEALTQLADSPMVQRFIQESREKEVVERNAAYKKKVIDITETKFRFNVNSNKQLQALLYEYMELPIIDLTDTKQPATGATTLKKLAAHTDNEDYLNILQAIQDFGAVEKILTAFISKFLTDSVLCPDGVYRIFGSFKLGGTVSARLSSSNPNIQQIPSGSRFGKLIKSCFVAPPGKVFVMSDFAALEDVVNTLLTKDPEKVKVLVEGFDGHMYRAMHFWPDKFPGVDLNSPDEVNGYKKLDWADKVRSAGKPVHFSQQYQGTWATLMSACGFPEQEARTIEDNYRKLYSVSFDWVADRTAEASRQGYATCAFGLRVRTPLLSQVMLGNRNTPREAAAEARTLGNAVSGQSYCLLNGRASMEFMKRVRASEYRYDIELCAHIHDAIYLYCTDKFEVIKWVNDNLIDCMRWQDLPELQHETIRLSSELDIAYPTWKDAFTLKNDISLEELKVACMEEYVKRTTPDEEPEEVVEEEDFEYLDEDAA